MLDRLRHLFSLYPKCLTPLFLGSDADMALLNDVRNFLNHFGSQKAFDTNFLWSRSAGKLNEKAQIFLEICLLGTVGLSDEEIFNLLQQFTPYKDCSFETSIEMMNKLLFVLEPKTDPSAASAPE